MDKQAEEQARLRWDSLAKPLGSLGLLEDAVVQIAGLTGSADVKLSRRTLLVLCADNGVVAQGVAQSDSSVTAAVARALGAGESTVCHMARTASCHVVTVDVGIRDFTGAPGVLDHRVRNGTSDITQGPAMTRAECIQAIETGMELVRAQKTAGADVLAVGELGIGNTTTSSAVAAVLLDRPAEELTGRGAGLSDAGLVRKIAAVGRAVSVNHPNPADPVDVLARVGGLDLAALCGVCLGGAQYRIPVLLDGFISTVAALCAVRLRPEASAALIASHVSAEPASALVLEALGKRPLIAAGLRLGEGSGAVAALPLLDMALAVYNSGHTFGALGLEPYTPQS